MYVLYAAFLFWPSIFGICREKVNFLFILYSTEITTLLFTWSFLVRFDFCSVFIGYNIGCKHGLHLENDLESYFNE